MRLLSLPVLLAGALFATGITADTCEALKSNSRIEVAGRARPAYFSRWYWSTACKALKPSCVLLPTSSAQVADIVNVLKDMDEPFAVKSGGHNPNPYFSSVEGGPLISMEKLNDVTFDKKSKTVRFGPGNRWEDVVKTLDGTGYTIVGGRIGHVGVGGLVLGGGLSYLSAQHGWAANSVLEYDIVLANGTAVTTSASKHPELFLALKGGGNNYGIVTSFLVRAYPQGDVWGGSMSYKHSEKTKTKLLSALRDFADSCEDDKAAVIVVNVRTRALHLDLWIVFAFYDGPEPPPGVFDNFLNAKPFINTCKTKSYKKLLTEGNLGVIHGTIYTITTETMPLPSKENCDAVLGAIHDRWRETTGNVLKNTTGLTANVAYQPFTKRMARISREKGGDLLDMDDDVNRIILEYNYSHLFAGQHDGIDYATTKTAERSAELIRGFQKDGRLPEAYLPLFVNDAYFRQDFWGRVKPERRELAKKVAADVDPKGLWRSRTGGFKP